MSWCTVDFDTTNHFVTEKPTIGETENIHRNSVEITFFDPLFLRKTEYGDWIQLTGYTVTRRPHRQEESNTKPSNFPYDVNSPTSDASPNQPRRMKLAGLMPGKKYKLTVTAHYSDGESIPSEEREFTTKPAGMYLDIVNLSCSVSHKINSKCIFQEGYDSLPVCLSATDEGMVSSISTLYS